MGKHGIICNKGINDMPRGWYSESEYNKRVYIVWHNMLKRCYSEKLHEKHQTYIGCTVCERWLTLSNFVEDIVKIDNYQYWKDNPNQKISLDKDIKSNGKNKCYCLSECQFANKSENTRQANKTRDYEQFRGENHPNHGELVAQIDKNTNRILNLKYNREYIQLGFHAGNITNCCKGRHKTSQGYIFKYISDCTDEQINEYIIKTKQIKIE